MGGAEREGEGMDQAQASNKLDSYGSVNERKLCSKVLTLELAFAPNVCCCPYGWFRLCEDGGGGSGFHCPVVVCVCMEGENKERFLATCRFFSGNETCQEMRRVI